MLEQLTALLKGLTYLAAFSGAGTVFARCALLRGQPERPSLTRLIRASGILLALTASATALVYMLRLGETLDTELIRAVLLSPLGAALGLQIIGGIGLAVFASRPLASFAAIMVVISFGLSGHAATRGIPSSASVLVHVSAAAWWLGGLWVLLIASRTAEGASFAALVRAFSRQAIWVVGLLIVAAIATAAQLLNFHLDWARSYDLGLIAKACLTLGLLMLAAANRFWLSARLETSQAAIKWLRGTIIAEMLLFLSVFATTARLTTWHSPHDLDHEAEQAVGPITIVDPWAPATIGSLLTGAGYMTIVNNTHNDDRLLSASSPWAEKVTLHVSTSDGSIVRMRDLDAPVVPARGNLTFSPGANHLMLTGLYSPLLAGDTVPVTLRFQNAGEINLMLKVLAIGERPSQPHNH